MDPLTVVEHLDDSKIARRACALVANTERFTNSVFRVEKNDLATAMSQHCPGLISTASNRATT
jgi:hypothetical protein